MSERETGGARMGALERLFPRWAYRRACFKAGLEDMKAIRAEQRSYDAGRADRLNAGWRTTNAPPGATDDMQRDVIRARARDLERNSDIFSAMILAFVRGVVGWGLQLQPDTGDDALDTRIAALFDRWRRARNCDAAGSMTFDEMCQTIVRRKLVDGGILIVKSYSAGEVPLKLQLIEVDQLSSMALKPRYEGDYIVGGVEVDKLSAPRGYWIEPRTPDEMAIAEPVFIESKDAIFYKSQTRPGQIREMSPAAVAMPRLRDVEGFIEAQSMKERIAACFAAFIRRQSGQSVLGMGGARRDDPQTKPYSGSTITPGMIAHLGLDEDVSFAQPPASSGEASNFTRLLTRMTGAAMGLSYEAASRDLSQVTYSSARQGLIEDESTYAIEQQSLIDHVLTEVYESFIISAVLSGALDIPDFWERKREYMKHDWIPQGRQWIDPKKEADANAIALQTGLKPFSEIAGAAGYDWRALMQQLKAEQEYAEDIGLKLPWKGQQKNADAPKDGGEQDEGEEE